MIHNLKFSSAKTVATVIALGAFLTGIGVLTSLILSRGDQKGIEIIPISHPANPSNLPSVILVDVAGAVEKPGVYRLPLDSRLSDALTAAGGLAVNADRNYLSQSINLAQKATDGSKIYIPAVGESDLPSEASAKEGQSFITTLISINSASLSQLDTLSGVGAVRAQAIIDGRPYTRIEELTERKILPQSVFDKNKDKLTL